MRLITEEEVRAVAEEVAADGECYADVARRLGIGMVDGRYLCVNFVGDPLDRTPACIVGQVLDRLGLLSGWA